MSSALLQPPKTVADTGLPEPLLRDLLLKHLYSGVNLDLAQLRDRLKLNGNLLEVLLQVLKKEQRVQANIPMNGGGVRYQLTELGIADANNAFLRGGYVGPAPISLSHYEKLVAQQSVLGNTISRAQVMRVFENVVIDPHHLDVFGPALHSGKALLVYGHAGTGKTYISKKLMQLLDDAVYIPYALAVDQEIIQFFDPLIHKSAEQARDTTSLDFAASIDPRLLRIERPMAISGGELTMERLELNYDPVTRSHNAPVQMKANNGLYLLDDLGRQRMSPTELFNRWIVPMEERRDYLALANGKHFSVPFDCVLIFSTNLAPTDLADEAFLRRLGYKLHFRPIDRTQFQAIWADLLGQRQVLADDGLLEWLFQQFSATGRELLPCHPRDLLDIALDIGAYLQQPKRVNLHNMTLAWNTYFVDLRD